MDLRAVLLAWLLACCAPAFAAGAEEDREAQGIRSVITAQLQAFAEDDADAAFDTSTPAVRESMGHAGYFLALVRGQYPMVYRPVAISFLDVELKSREAWQLVRVIDQDGRPWVVMFALERQGDGTWRIGGCAVSEMRGKPA
ncbi:MAG: DUF4864 domain-containing protein [Burkholderiales bacterium]|nr:DUF4864 domain-containing protein [Burkholderiales bacterium]